MKKLIVFILLLSALSSTSFFKLYNNNIWQIEGLEKVCFVGDSQIEDLDYVQCGDLYFNFCTVQKAKENLKNYQKSAKNIQFYIKNDDFSEVFDKIMFEETEKQILNGRTIYLGNSPYFDKFIWTNQQRTNLQISVFENEIIIGSPVILTGF